MRAARRADYRRQAAAKKYPRLIQSASVLAAPGLGAGVTLEFKTPVTVLCGLNGSGKTRLLRVIAELAVPGSVPDATIARQIHGATCNMKVENEGVQTTYVLPIASPVPLTILWFDPVLTVAEIARQFRELGDLASVLDGVDPHPLRAEVLELIQSIVQRDYTAVESFDLTEDGLAHPYFRMRWSGATYGVEDMALGEIGAAYLLYLLDRAEPATVVFLEEPESFLSPIGQAALMDAIHYFCVKRAITVVISTHSPTIAAEVPRECLFVVERTAPNSVIVRSMPQPEALAAIAIGYGVRGLIFVEDAIAELFTREVLRRHRPSYQNSIEVVVAGDKVSVHRSARAVKSVGSRLPSVGILDGDARRDPQPDDLTIFFLPGDLPPERILRNAVSTDPDRLAKYLGVTLEIVNTALTRARGHDDHDWIPTLADAVGLDVSGITRALIDVWLQDAANEASAKEMFTQLELTFSAL